MSLIRQIKIGISADTGKLSAGVRGAIGDLDKLTEASRQAQAAVGSLDVSKTRAPGPSASDKGSGAAASPADGLGMLLTLAPRVQSALTTALGPLTTFGERMSGQINRIGGIFLEFVERFDAGWRQMTANAMLQMHRLADEEKKHAAANNRNPITIAPNVNIPRLQSVLGGRGDISKAAPLERFGKVDLARPAAQVGMMAGNFRTLAPAANQAATAVKGLGLQIGMAFGLVGVVYKASAALKDFFVGGIKGASDLNETMSKTKEVFGANMAPVEAEADRLAKSYGFLKGPMLDAASSFGLVFKGAKVAEGESAAMSKTLLTLAADATSFYNVPLETSLEKIRSGLVGEAEPLRAFGILLNEDAVKARAAALGLGNVKGKLDDASKTAARFSLIQQGLSTASGDLARTQGETASQFRKAGGGLGNFATSIGTLLLPAVKLATTMFNELLFSIVEVFESNKGRITSWAGTLTSALDMVGYAIRNYGELWQIAQLSATQSVANFSEYLAVLPTNLGIIANYVAGNWREMIATGVQFVSKLFENLGGNIGKVAFSISNFLSTGEWLKPDFTPLLDGFKSTVEQFPELVKPKLTDLSGEMGNIFAEIDRKEAARKASLAPIAGPKPAIPEAPEAPGEGAKYKGTAAARLGSQEASSVLSRFRNQSGGDDASKQTATNTKSMAETLKSVAESLAYMKNAKASGNATSLAIAKL